MKKALTVMGVALLMSGCSMPDIDNAEDIGTDNMSVVEMPVDGDTVTCVKFYKKAHKAGAGGLSCNWEEYNGRQ